MRVKSKMTQYKMCLPNDGSIFWCANPKLVETFVVNTWEAMWLCSEKKMILEERNAKLTNIIRTIMGIVLISVISMNL